MLPRSKHWMLHLTCTLTHAMITCKILPLLVTKFFLITTPPDIKGLLSFLVN